MSATPPGFTFPVETVSRAAVPSDQRQIVALGLKNGDESDPVAAMVSALNGLNGATEYEAVAPSASDTQIGGAGAVGDLLVGILVTPLSTSPGAVAIKDGGTGTTVFAGGASSLSNLAPFFISFGAGIKSLASGWKVTTGANVQVIAVGNFT